jgi:hypothetical protein
MIRFFAALAVLAFAALPAAASEDCPFRPGDYVVSNLDDKHYVVIDVNEYGCFVDYRSVDATDQPFDPYISSMMGDFLAPYDGPVDNPKDYGCPWQAGDFVDAKTLDGWRAAMVTGSDKTCTYTLDVYIDGLANDGKVNSYEANDLMRAATLQRPTPKEMEEAKVCPPGGAIEDFADDSFDSSFKRAIIADVSERMKEPVHMTFQKIREGQMTVVQQGDSFRRDHPDAAIGAEIYPFRLNATVCTDSSGRPEVAEHVFDYNCYTDKFGDFVCRHEAQR